MDSDIEFGKIEQAEPQTQLRPDCNHHFAVVSVGVPSESDLPIFVDLDVMRDMELHALSDARVELGGVLLGGQYTDDAGRPFVVVSDSLRARHHESTKGSFKFTHETWEQITRERAEFPPELQMVGWYHTHPDWGVFLSSLDMFICDNFFNKPLDLALVIDPCRQDRGFFQWTNDNGCRVRRTDGYFLTASRFRLAELKSFAAQLEGTLNMTHLHPSSSAPANPPASVIQIAQPVPQWQMLAVMAMLSLQFCFLLLFAWRTLPDDRDGIASRQAAALQGSLDRLVVARDREAEIDAKLQVLELVVSQGGTAPDRVLKSLSEETARVHELQSSLRGQQSLSRELDGKIAQLEASLADARQRDKRRETEVAALNTEVTKLVAQLEESHTQLKAAQVTEGAGPGEQLSWWSTFWANSKPISLGVILGAMGIGAVMAMVYRSKKPASIYTVDE